MFLIKKVKSSGGNLQELSQLFTAWVESRILYCSTLFFNLSASHLKQLQGLYIKAFKWGFIQSNIDLSVKLKERDKMIFCQIERDVNHPLYKLLPQQKRRQATPSAYQTKYYVPAIRLEMFKNSLFVRMV